MTFVCQRCGRVAEVTVTKEQATYFGGCEHVEQIEADGTVSYFASPIISTAIEMASSK